MTIFFRILLILPLLAACQVSARPANDYQNPVIDADYSDPDVIRMDDNFYLVASSFNYAPGIPLLRSHDLVHWTIVGHVLDRLRFSPAYDMVPPFTLDDTRSKPVDAGLRYGRGVWAPALRFHDGRYYVYWPTPDEGIFMATASDPAGPWSAPVTLANGAGYEDPCPFWDDDGQAYLIHSRVGAGPLILHRMNAEGTQLLDGGAVIVEDAEHLPTLEGPKLYKRAGYYYIFAPFGGVGTGSQAVLRSRNIRGPYEWRTVLERGNTDVQAPHQGAYVETADGQGWFFHFNSTGAFGRIDYLEPVHWQDDWPLIGDPIPGKTSGQPVARHAAPKTRQTAAQSATPEHRQDSDEFTTPALGVQWEWNHNPDDSRWSLGARPGFLRLQAGPAENLVTARNTLTQMLQGPKSRYTARVDLSHMVEGQRAGLVLFGARPIWVGAAVIDGVPRLLTAAAGVESVGGPLPGPQVIFRADVSEDQTVSFSWSGDEGWSYTKAAEPLPLPAFAWWRGSRPGLFTYIKAKPDATVGDGWIDVDWFHVDQADP